MKSDNAESLRESLLNGCRTVGELRRRLIHDYPTAPDRNLFLRTASKLLVDLCSGLKASTISSEKPRSRFADQLYVLALDLSPRIDRLDTSIGAIEEARSRRSLEEAWITLLDGLHKLEALTGPVEMSDFFGTKSISAAPSVKTMGPRVFLSYAHDDASKVESLRRDLIAKGLDVWWDRQILAGEDWEMAIRNAIEESTAVVVCFSKNVDSKRRSGIFPEVLRALEIYRNLRPGSIFLIPVRLNDCEIPRFKIDAVRDLASLQYENLFPDSRWNDGVDRIVQAVLRTAEK